MSEAFARLRFLGAVGTVTGSRFLLQVRKRQYLVDCGLFQGYKQLRLRNWAKLPFSPRQINAVVLTHAHLDHSGFLPVLCRDGYTGPIYATPATRDLCRYLLPDSGFIQEKDAALANRYGHTRHQPARPLYTQADAEASLKQFKSLRFAKTRKLDRRTELMFRRAGHIPGAAMAEFTIDGNRVVFSGDLGHDGSATIPPPEQIKFADYLVLESTYGNRRRDRSDPEQALAEVVSKTVARGGTVIVPAFAVGRTQLLLHHLRRLIDARRIPRVPVFLDSPLAINATEVFANHPDDHRLSRAEAEAACSLPRYVHDPEESKRLDADPVPKIIIAGSGMATGGRVLHHLKVYAPDPRHSILFSGYQAAGTRGAAMLEGAETIKIHGQHWPVRAEVCNLDMLSAHADADEILAWLAAFERPPRRIFIVHGEPAASDTLRQRIEEELGYPCLVPEALEPYSLT
ncbi:MAG: MBL fold metallo-hydrolase [Wenzhouxiangella sp.]|nr:MAG: MBL fold metallo-hydrolase [Wenzhouxiangella sp.]